MNRIRRSRRRVGLSPRGSAIFRKTRGEAHATATFVGNVKAEIGAYKRSLAGEDNRDTEIIEGVQVTPRTFHGKTHMIRSAPQKRERTGEILRDADSDCTLRKQKGPSNSKSHGPVDRTDRISTTNGSSSDQCSFRNPQQRHRQPRATVGETCFGRGSG